MKHHIPLVSLMILGLSACGAEEPSAGGLTPEQNASLDKAADTLDAQHADLPARDDGAKAKKSKPE